MTAQIHSIFERDAEGRMLAIRNWRGRDHAEDALVAIPLTRSESEILERLRGEGIDDAQIFDRLYLKPRRQGVRLPIDELTPAQLCALLRQIVDEPLPSLERLTPRDLAALLRTLCDQRDDWLATLT